MKAKAKGERSSSKEKSTSTEQFFHGKKWEDMTKEERITYERYEDLREKEKWHKKPYYKRHKGSNDEGSAEQNLARILINRLVFILAMKLYDCKFIHCF